MKKIYVWLASLALLASGLALADSYSDAIDVFKKAGESATFFSKSYGYAVFPTVGEGGFVLGAARGKGRVYVHGALVGDTNEFSSAEARALANQTFDKLAHAPHDWFKGKIARQPGRWHGAVTPVVRRFAGFGMVF